MIVFTCESCFSEVSVGFARFCLPKKVAGKTCLKDAESFGCKSLVDGPGQETRYRQNRARALWAH